MNKLKIIVISTSPLVVNSFMHEQIMLLAENNHVTVVTNTDSLPKLEFPDSRVDIKNVRIIRKISIWRDFLAFIKILLILVKYDFDLVYTITPKAGLLGMVAGLLACVKCRIHIFTGQVWVTKAGVRREFLKLMDIFIAKSSTNLLTDSVSQMNFLIKENITGVAKIRVLANGSVNGVDLARFKKNTSVREKYREKYDINRKDVVFLYLGRLNSEKGIMELVEAFIMLLNKHNNIKLLIVGPDEQHMHEIISIKLVSYADNFRMVDFTECPENYMNMADVLCVPSYREGFGSVVIEAASVGLPAIGSNIYGLKDAIENNVTGLLFTVKDVNALYVAMQKLIINPELRLRLGEAARARAERLFSQDYVATSYVEYIQSCCVR